MMDKLVIGESKFETIALMKSHPLDSGWLFFMGADIDLLPFIKFQIPDI